MNPVLHAKLARNDSLSAARHFVNCGFRPIPIPGKSKAPDMANWPNFKAELDSLEELFSPQCNVGLLLGERANGLIDVDLDCAEAIALAPHWLLSTGWIHGRQHYWATSPTPPAPDSALSDNQRLPTPSDRKWAYSSDTLTPICLQNRVNFSASSSRDDIYERNPKTLR